MSKNSTSKTNENKKNTSETMKPDYDQIWNEVKKKWASYGISLVDDESINNVIKTLKDELDFLRIKKILESYQLKPNYVMLYLTIFMNPHISTKNLLKIINSKLSKEKHLASTTLHELLKDATFEKTILVSGKEGGNILYEPGFPLYELISPAVEHREEYNKWDLNTGEAFFFLLEKKAEDIPDVKILLEKVKKESPQYGKELIFPAIKVKKCIETIKEKKEIKEMFTSGSFDGTECNLPPVCYFPLSGESHYQATLCKVEGKMKSKIENIVKDPVIFNKITKLDVEECLPLSYYEAFYKHRLELNPRVLFYISAILCQYYVKKHDNSTAKEVINSTLERMEQINHKIYYDTLLSANGSIKEQIQHIVKSVKESREKKS